MAFDPRRSSEKKPKSLLRIFKKKLFVNNMATDSHVSSLYPELPKDSNSSLYGCPEMDCFMNESMSDVVFIIEGQRLPAIRAFLSVKSRVFRDMFSGFKVSKTNGIVIRDTTFEAFKSLIQFLYCDVLVLKKDNDFQLIREVCELSHRYETLKVLDKIGDHLKTIPLTYKNLNSISRIAFEYKIEDLKSYILEFIETNLNQLVKKGLKKLKELNESTHSELFRVMVKFYLKSVWNQSKNKSFCPKCGS